MELENNGGAGAGSSRRNELTQQDKIQAVLKKICIINRFYEKKEENKYYKIFLVKVIKNVKSKIGKPYSFKSEYYDIFELKNIFKIFDSETSQIKKFDNIKVENDNDRKNYSFCVLYNILKELNKSKYTIKYSQVSEYSKNKKDKFISEYSNELNNIIKKSNTQYNQYYENFTKLNNILLILNKYHGNRFFVNLQRFLHNLNILTFTRTNYIDVLLNEENLLATSIENYITNQELVDVIHNLIKDIDNTYKFLRGTNAISSGLHRKYNSYINDLNINYNLSVVQIQESFNQLRLNEEFIKIHEIIHKLLELKTDSNMNLKKYSNETMCDRKADGTYGLIEKINNIFRGDKTKEEKINHAIAKIKRCILGRYSDLFYTEHGMFKFKQLSQTKEFYRKLSELLYHNPSEYDNYINRLGINIEMVKEELGTYENCLRHYSAIFALQKLVVLLNNIRNDETINLIRIREDIISDEKISKYNYYLNKAIGEATPNPRPHKTPVPSGSAGAVPVGHYRAFAPSGSAGATPLAHYGAFALSGSAGAVPVGHYEAFAPSGSAGATPLAHYRAFAPSGSAGATPLAYYRDFAPSGSASGFSRGGTKGIGEGAGGAGEGAGANLILSEDVKNKLYSLYERFNLLYNKYNYILLVNDSSINGAQKRGGQLNNRVSNINHYTNQLNINNNVYNFDEKSIELGLQHKYKDTIKVKKNIIKQKMNHSKNINNYNYIDITTNDVVVNERTSLFLDCFVHEAYPIINEIYFKLHNIKLKNIIFQDNRNRTITTKDIYILYSAKKYVLTEEQQSVYDRYSYIFSLPVDIKKNLDKIQIQFNQYDRRKRRYNNV